MKKRALTALFAALFVLLASSCSKGTYDVEDGEGSFTYEDGTRIEATFASGEINGKCKIIYTNGDIYEGELSDGKKTGEGKYTWKDKTVYEGDFSDDKKSGKGKLSLPDGKLFEGEFLDDSIVSGTLTVKDEYVYKGKFSGGLPNDTAASITYPDSSRYDGAVKDGKRAGQGKITYSDGSSISGGFTDGVLQGSCIFYSPIVTDTFINNVGYPISAGENKVTVKDGKIISVP